MNDSPPAEIGRREQGPSIREHLAWNDEMRMTRMSLMGPNAMAPAADLQSLKNGTSRDQSRPYSKRGVREGWQRVIGTLMPQRGCGSSPGLDGGTTDYPGRGRERRGYPNGIVASEQRGREKRQGEQQGKPQDLNPEHSRDGQRQTPPLFTRLELFAGRNPVGVETRWGWFPRGSAIDFHGQSGSFLANVRGDSRALAC